MMPIFAVVVDGLGQTGFEAHQMGTIIGGIDVIHERKDIFCVAVVMLEATSTSTPSFSPLA